MGSAHTIQAKVLERPEWLWGCGVLSVLRSHVGSMYFKDESPLEKE
jgi:hypothetical protein